MDLLMITTNKNKASEQIEELSKKFHIEYGMYCIRGEDFSGLYKTGNFKNLLTEIYRLANLSEKEEQEVTIQACQGEHYAI